MVDKGAKTIVGQGPGYVQLVDWMGDDEDICIAARTSYGKGTRSVRDNRGLIRYLMRHRHTTPFEQCEIKFLVECPMDVWRQWIRHRTANVNEYSTRYSEALDTVSVTPPDGWRGQAVVNRQGSSGMVEQWPEGWSVDVEGVVHRPDGSVEVMGPGSWTGPVPTVGDYLSWREAQAQGRAREIYEERLELGVAREQARKDLPLSTFTRAYWKMDLHNILHFLSLRLDSHAQAEIRSYALAVASFVEVLYPLAWEAFVDYRLGAMVLSSLDVDVVVRINRGEELAVVLNDIVDSKGEKDECYRKMKRLGYAG